MKNLDKQLKEQSEIVEKESAKLRTLIHKKEREELVPLAKSYLGKYYKYRNSYGSDSHWMEYGRVVKVKGTSLTCQSIGIDDRSELQVAFKVHKFIWKSDKVLIGEFEYYKPSTKEEFESKKKEILKKMRSIGTLLK